SKYLVSGFNVEYAAGPFALFFLAEYANIIIINILTTILFFGAFHNPLIPELYSINFTIKTLLLTFLSYESEHHILDSATTN
uniref:NADH-ubiquinone oxidoreductase chain 1 n=2 Tax=Canis lupus familiaris TaxID=9615 RepID=A0A8I3NNC7_CANLF